MNAQIENAQYEMRERMELGKQLRELAKQPLADRQEARKDWMEAMTTPGLVRERVAWLLDGSYGYGAYQEANRIARNKRCNRVANLGVLIAGLEWRCPGDFAQDGWKRLTPAQQATVNAEVQAAIDAHLNS